MTRYAKIVHLGYLEYCTAWELQKRLVTARELEEIPDTLLLLEHDAVYTIGRSGRPAHWGGQDDYLKATGLPVYFVERGGSITYHGPGQLVGYPILRLNIFCPGPKAFVSMLEEVVIRALQDWNISAERRPKLPGVWSGDEKIASVGVRITHGITMHGFALNVDPDLAPFSRVSPCGIAGCRVTSMAHIVGRPVEVDAVRMAITKHFAEVFQVEWETEPERNAPSKMQEFFEVVGLPHGTH